MEIKFDANQAYQLDAIDAVTNLFEGQMYVESELRLGMGSSSLAAVGNRLDLSDADLLENLNGVQTKNVVPADKALATITNTIKTAEGEDTASFYNFSVEMETGTGKTYVYLRTALELAQRYGMRKFIIVVPSIAIRAGVIKTLEMTRRHFAQLYSKLPYRFYEYSSKNLSQVRQFALSDSIELMVMTLDAFNKSSNIIRQPTDRFQGETPIHLIQAARPILILDEPQNMESEKSVAALSVLHPLFALRYSATHRFPYNIVYRLTPYEAYRQGLVKKIEVASVVREGETGQPYIRLEKITTQKNTIRASLSVRKRNKSGTISESSITVSPADSAPDALVGKTGGRRAYAGYGIEEINPGYNMLRFTNGQEMYVGDEIGADKDAIFREQIRYTIVEHFRKQRRLKDVGVKVLTLFFIDRVSNYADEDGVIRKLFDEEFEHCKQEYPEWQDKTADEVQAAYFAQRRTRSGQVVLEDSATGEAQKDDEAYRLIMHAKEQLLSFEEPVSFIFSHSALKEGWDNPNVFQICTLNQTASTVRKRQEVGRGVRLAVDRNGDRVFERKHNILTVVPNESHALFVSGLQSEIALEFRELIEARYGKPIDKLSEDERARIAEEYGEGILPPPPEDARKRVTVQLNKAYMLSPDFQELWERIKHKTRYSVHIDTAKLVSDAVSALEQVEVKPPRIEVVKVSVEASDENEFVAMQLSGAKTLESLAGRYPLPNLVDLIITLLHFTTPPVRVTRQTVLEILRQSPHPKALVESPREFATEAARIIKDELAAQLVDGIQYQRIDEWYVMEQFEADFQAWSDHLVKANKSVYDGVVYESEIERNFALALEHRNDVKLYVKLPGWFTVDTPIGSYNPDWAIVMEERDEFGEAKDTLYLVRETKSTKLPSELRQEEWQKIQCGKKHFNEALEGVNYELVVTADELP